MFVIGFFLMYMLGGDDLYYGAGTFLSRPANDGGEGSQVIFIQAFGLFVFLHGLYRCFCGIVISQHVRDRYFLWYSSAILFVAQVLLLTSVALQGKILQHQGLIWATEVFAALGRGNMWGILFNFSVKIYNRKAALIGW